MNDTNWKKVQELFEQALNLESSKRELFLKTECGENNDLYNEVSSLLEADEELHPVLSKKASEIINSEEKINFIGQNIGSYKIVEEIATGGMGTVFLAERSDGFFEQKVALKVVKPGLSTIPIIRRFQHERQILANLHHPNIARLYDGGVTEDRRPFFTMEFVDGIPIDEYCDKKKLTINERLKLFIKVCETVQYAHNNLVIHRDLKPNNILIQKDGNIKLLDFGISKVLSAESETSDIPTITQAEINLLTPEYSSPEQIKNSNISVSTDVYSLGLILYKLLTGKSAHEFQSYSFVEYEKVVCEKSIQRPSTVYAKLNEINSEVPIFEIFENRKTNRGKLAKKLNGDLDNICMMALRKEPERRYASVEMLAYDIERYLANLPILARKESFLYVAQKFINRHKAAVTAAIALFFIVNGLILFYTFQLKAERDKAQIEAKKSEQVASFLQNLFLVSDPNESKGETITAREILDRGATRLIVGLDEEPEIKSQLLNTIGNVYSNLGLFDSAEEIFLKIKSYPNIESIDDETFFKSMINLGRLYRLKGEYNLAKEILFATLEKCKKSLSENHPIIAECLSNLGGYYYETGIYDTSRIYYDKSEILFRKNFGNEHEKIASTLNAIAALVFEQGDLDKSDSLYREALRIEIKLKGEIDAGVATNQNDLGMVLRHKGEFEESRILYEKALATRLKLFGDQHPDVAHTYNHLSRLYYNQNLYDEAEPLARKALDIRIKIFDQDHPEITASRSSLAGVLFEKGMYKESEKLYRKAYDSSVRKLGEKHPYSPAILGNIGRTLLEQKKYNEAEILILRSIDILKEIFGFEHKYLIVRTNWLSDLYNQTSRFTEAEELLRIQLDSVRNKPLETHWLTSVTKSILGYCLYKQDKNLEAEGLMIYAYNAISEQRGKNNPEAQKALQRIIEFYRSQNRMDKVSEYMAMM